MDDNMTEKKNGVSELKKEEMARVTGGADYDERPSKDLTIKKTLTIAPHCPGCGNVVESFSGNYKCKTSGCKYKGDIIDPKDLIWK